MRRLVALGAGACLLACGAVALLLLTSRDAHAVTLGPVQVPVDVQVPVPVPLPVPGPAQPVIDTIAPVIQPVIDTVTPIIEPVMDTVTPVPVVAPPIDLPELPTIPSLPSTQLPVLGATDGALPSAVHGGTSLAAPLTLPTGVRVSPLPRVLGNELVRPRGLGSAASALSSADVPGGSRLPAQSPSAPPFLPQQVTHSTSSSSLDTARGLRLLLFAIAATLTALYLTRGRRVLPFGAVMPRYAFVSLIERPG